MMSATMLADRAVLRIAGEDVRGFLQGLITNDVAALDAGPVWAGLLSPQGKALFDFILWADGDDVLVDCEATRADALLRRLAIYRLRRSITLSLDADVAVHWTLAGDRGVPDPRLPDLGQRWVGPPSERTEAWLAHRLSLGVTEGVAELGDGETLWLECNARELNGVSFTKGCYVGQENTARMHHRAKVNRRLVVAPLVAESDRTRASYPELGLMVNHRRVDALGDALIPAWLTPEIASG